MKINKYAHPTLPNTPVDDQAIVFSNAARGLKSTTDAPARKKPLNQDCYWLPLKLLLIILILCTKFCISETRAL